MIKKKYNKNIEFENNTYYYVDEDIIDFYKEDTISLSNLEYYCSSNRYSLNHDTCIYINNKENIILDFNGATLFMHGALTPIIIANSKNIEIKNVKIKYDRSFFTEMVLLDKGENYLKVKIDKDKFPYLIKDGRFMPKSDYWIDETIHEAYIFIQEFDSITRKGLSWPVVMVGNKDKEEEILPWGGTIPVLLAYDEGNGIVTFKGKNVPDYHVGSILELCMNNRDIANLTIYNSKDIKIENYRIINGLGMGILPIYTENLTIDALKMYYDKESIGIVSNTADGLHAVSMKGNLVIKNSIFEGMIDDAFNIHSNYYLVDSIDKNILIAKCPGASDTFKIFGENDSIAIYNGHSMEKADEAIIKTIISIDAKTYKFILDKEIKAVEKGSLIENLSTQPNIYISNSRFGKANTHLRFQSRGEIVVDNIDSEMDLLFTGDTNYWSESSPVKNIVIKNSKFDTTRYAIGSIPEFKSTIKEPYYHENILVENCNFTNEMGLYMRYANNIVFKNNKNEKNKPFKIYLDNSGIFDSIDNDVEIERVNTKAERDE